MDTRSIRGFGRSVSAILLSVVLPAAWCRGEVAEWDQPDLDTWSYVNAVYLPFANQFPGTRAFAPSFGGLELDEASNELAPGFASRGGFNVFAFETTDLIEPGLDPSRYKLNSVSVTLTAERGQSGPVVYTETPLTIESALEDVRNDDFGEQVPVELFGVGFSGGFEGFDLGVVETGQRYSETDRVWENGEPLLYPADAEGGRDSTNSLNGGRSASEPSGETDPFTHTPFAIGTVPGASEGDQLPNDTTFYFDLDVDHEGIAEYLTKGLSEGVVGFAVSTLHGATMDDTGNGGLYPQWYTRDAAGFFLNAKPASLLIDFKVLPLPGDYNADGEVDGLDRDAWAAAYGGTVPTPGAGADGNGDGVIDAADYTVWRDAVQETVVSIAVPEPGAMTYLVGGLVLAVFCGGTVSFTGGRGPRE